MLQGLFLCILETGQARRVGGGGGWGGGGEVGLVLSYISRIGMCRPKEYDFLRRFVLKTGIDFAHFGLESDMVFERATGGLNAFVVSIPNE